MLYLPNYLHSIVISLLLAIQVSLPYHFFLSDELPLAIPLVLVCWQCILSVFLPLLMSLFHFHLWVIFFLNIEFWVFFFFLLAL